MQLCISKHKYKQDLDCLQKPAICPALSEALRVDPGSSGKGSGAGKGGNPTERNGHQECEWTQLQQRWMHQQKN